MRRLFLSLLLLCSLPQWGIAQQRNESTIISIVKSQLQNELTSAESSALQIYLNDFHKSDQSQLEHYYFQQSYNGITIYGSESSIHLKADGSIFKFNNNLRKGLSTSKLAIQTPITPIEAIEFAGKHLGYPTNSKTVVQSHTSLTNRKQTISNKTLSKKEIPVKLVYTLSDTNKLTLAWELKIYETRSSKAWNLKVNTNTGEIIDKNSLILNCNFNHRDDTHQCSSHATKNNPLEDNSPTKEAYKAQSATAYRVYPIPLAHPGEGARALINNPDNTLASPFGWHDTNGIVGAEFTTTQGNNVHAYEDGNNPGHSPNGINGLNFDFPLDLTNDPEVYEDAALTNLFYWNNIVHDVLYQYGFDEQSGNFQANNYGKGGIGGDYVKARAQVGPLCNATFSFTADGTSPEMSMYVCNGKDGNFSNAIMIHEYGHGLSIRLTGGPSAAGCLNNVEQMGEGWSDYLSLMFTMKPGDLETDACLIGDWLFNDPTGIRPYPYSTDMAVNPHTYQHTFSGTSQPHGIGAVWCAMLWEMTWNLIDEFGYDPDLYNGTGGNNMALQLVVEAMKLQPCSPGFVDGRDAILDADQALYFGASKCLIWNAFAKRGLGVNADQGSSSNRSDGVEAFGLPYSCGGTGCLLRLTNTSAHLPDTASNNNTFLVESDGGWMVTTTATWITLNTKSGFGNDIVSYDVSSSPIFIPRTDTIKVSCSGFSRNFIVEQDAKPCTQSYSPIPYTTDFESGALDSYWCIASTDPEGRIQVTGLLTPRDNSHLVMDRSVPGNFTKNEALLGLQLAGMSNVVLSFWWKELNDETHPEDGVFLSDDGGTTFNKVYDFGAGNPTYSEVTLSLTQLAAASGLSLTNSFLVKFQQYGYFPASTNGIAIDDVAVYAVNCSVGSPCADNNYCTINDVYTVTCNCLGTFEDTDNDGICETDDQCPGFDDNIDYDGDGVADGCDSSVFCGNCSTIIATYPHVEDFETGIENNCQYTGDDFDWITGTGSTNTGNTGPSAAHQGNYYYYIESSAPNYPSKVAVFQSNCYDLSAASDATIDFWFHMYGATMGRLELEVTTDQGASWTSIWSRTGNQGNKWVNETITIDSFIDGGLFSYRFSGTTNSFFTSDFALDQITIDIRLSGQGYSICNATPAIEIDGIPNEWGINDTVFHPATVIAGSTTSQTDLNAQFQVKWDDTYLYVLGQVQDDVFINDSYFPWDDDSFEILIDGGNEKSTSYDNNDHFLIFKYNDTTVHDILGINNPPGVDFEMDMLNDSYILETKIAWSYIGVPPPVAGQKIGLEIRVNDDDSGAARDATMSWKDLNDKGWSNSSVFGTLKLVDCLTPSLTFNVKAVLEGAYNPNTGMMTTSLYQLELLPGMTFSEPNQPGTETPPRQPYTIAPWSYPGTEGLGFSNSSYDSSSVDWVLLSLRTSTDTTANIHQAAGILKQDGTIAFLPGSNYYGSVPGPYYVLIEHRNHMGVLSAQALTPQYGVLTYDFSSQNSWTPSNSGFGQSELLPGLWGLYAADGDQLSDQTSYDVNGADRILWSMDNGIFMEYRAADLDLNGEITGADRILWSRNTGINSGVLK